MERSSTAYLIADTDPPSEGGNTHEIAVHSAGLLGINSGIIFVETILHGKADTIWAKLYAGREIHCGVASDRHGAGNAVMGSFVGGDRWRLQQEMIIEPAPGDEPWLLGGQAVSASPLPSAFCVSPFCPLKLTPRDKKSPAYRVGLTATP